MISKTKERPSKGQMVLVVQSDGGTIIGEFVKQINDMKPLSAVIKRADGSNVFVNGSYVNRMEVIHENVSNS
jgi:hypothetical protein